MKGRPISEAPRDGTHIVVEQMRLCGVPETGHYAFEGVFFAKKDGWWRKILEKNSSIHDSCIIQWWPINTKPFQWDRTTRTNWNYRPSNGTSCDIFYSENCERCIRERPIRLDYEKAIRHGLGCDIYLRTMAFSIGDANYPTEWTYDRNTGVPKCTAFELDKGEEAAPEQEPRCKHTIDMFESKEPRT